MATLSSPLRFEPFLRPMVWGGRSLASLHKRLPGNESYGESWELSDHPSHRTIVAKGPHAGLSVRDLMERHGTELLGEAASQYPVFPWLVKFLDARDWLSVQVHPDDASAPHLCPGEGGKTEVWFILSSQPGAKIWAGLKPAVTPDRFRAALENGTVVDCLDEIAPRPGQCIFLPAGTVHAVGGGVLLAEVQQTSDATFRLFDWNRKDAQGKSRPLHIEQGLAAIDWKQGPIQPTQVEDFPALDPTRWPHDLPSRRQHLVECPFFRLDYVQGREAIAPRRGRPNLFLMLAGNARFESGEKVHAGQVWLLPASMPETRLVPEGPGACMLTCSM